MMVANRHWSHPCILNIHPDEVREHRWDGNVKNLKKEYIQKIAEKFEDRVEELLREREEI